MTACHVARQRPVRTPLPERFLPILRAIPNHQNALLGFMVADAILEGAKVKSNGATHTLGPLEVSRHSFIDIIEVLSEAVPKHGFKPIAVLFEQITYKNNLAVQHEDGFTLADVVEDNGEPPTSKSH